MLNYACFCGGGTAFLQVPWYMAGPVASQARFGPIPSIGCGTRIAVVILATLMLHVPAVKETIWAHAFALACLPAAAFTYPWPSLARVIPPISLRFSTETSAPFSRISVRMIAGTLHYMPKTTVRSSPAVTFLEVTTGLCRRRCLVLPSSRVVWRTRARPVRSHVRTRGRHASCTRIRGG
jgi:hypothetical protein